MFLIFALTPQVDSQNFIIYINLTFKCLSFLSIGQTVVPNLYAITGHGSKGWTLGFGSVELLVDIIEGKETKVTCL
jgi:hypothetical protein